MNRILSFTTVFIIVLLNGCGDVKPALDLKGFASPDEVISAYIDNQPEVRSITGPNAVRSEVEAFERRVDFCAYGPRIWRKMNTYELMGSDGAVQVGFELQRFGGQPWKILDAYAIDKRLTPEPPNDDLVEAEMLETISKYLMHNSEFTRHFRKKTIAEVRVFNHRTPDRLYPRFEVGPEGRWYELQIIDDRADLSKLRLHTEQAGRSFQASVKTTDGKMTLIEGSVSHDSQRPLYFFFHPSGSSADKALDTSESWTLIYPKP